MTEPVKDDELIRRLLERPESLTFDCKRLGKVDKVLETVVAFANTQGGIVALGFEDPEKGTGWERVIGIQSRLMDWDELQRKLCSRITEPDSLSLVTQEIGCTLNDGSDGSIILIKVRASSRVHSIVDNGTFVRLEKGNKEIVANEITKLMYDRGVISAENQIEQVDFDLQGLLEVANPDAGRNVRCYRKPDGGASDFLSNLLGKEQSENT